MRPRTAATATVLVTLLGASPLAGRAWGFVRKLSSVGVPERWGGSCVPAAVYANGFAAMTRDEIAKSVGAAARAWGPDAVACGDGSHPYLEIVTWMAGAGDAAPPVAYDGHNTIAFETEGWSGDDISQVAVTYSFRQPGGRIVDTDLRINALYHAFADLDPGAPSAAQSDAFDLQNAITHEMGHVIGLDHTCRLDPDDPPTVDDQGNPVPDCIDATNEIRETTMFPATEPGFTFQRVLSADDVRAVCAIYPADADPRSCPLDLPDDGCGCAAAGSRANPLFVALAFALALSRARARRGGSAPTPRRG